jgi:hypothetical protein
MVVGATPGPEALLPAVPVQYEAWTCGLKLKLAGDSDDNVTGALAPELPALPPEPGEVTAPPRDPAEPALLAFELAPPDEPPAAPLATGVPPPLAPAVVTLGDVAPPMAPVADWLPAELLPTPPEVLAPR